MVAIVIDYCVVYYQHVVETDLDIGSMNRVFEFTIHEYLWVLNV